MNRPKGKDGMVGGKVYEHIEYTKPKEVTGREKLEQLRVSAMVWLAWDFTGMRRAFAKKSEEKIVERLLCDLPKLRDVNYGELHKAFCHWFVKTIKTAKRRQKASYGQAAKVLDVAMKCIVSYCNLPDEATAWRLLPQLHCGIDTKIFLYLKKKYRDCPGCYGLGDIDEQRYATLQRHLNEESKQRALYPVDYDDLLIFGKLLTKTNTTRKT